jgi:tetratricopeptide (TPR) repeat protein
VPPLDAARYWLAEQLQNCPARLDLLCRSKLFLEVESAVRSIDHMQHHAEAVAQSGHWCNYDVFLKASWRYLQETARTGSTLAAVVLLKMVQLYRRRPSESFQRAAARKLKTLSQLITQPGSGDHWLLGVTRYEEAYLKFLLSAESVETENAFSESAGFESRSGRPVGQFVSKAQAQVAGIRRLAPTAGQEIATYVTELRRTSDRLAQLDQNLARLWVNEVIPIQLAYVDLCQGKYIQVLESMDGLVARRNLDALWYTGVALFHAGEKHAAALRLEEARRGFYQQQRSEGRSRLLLSLGGAYDCLGQREQAHRAYEETIEQAPHMDNAAAIAVARRRLQLESPSRVMVYLNAAATPE